jgi:antitoxin HicB
MIEIDGYQINIEWSDEDSTYLISIPALSDECIMPCSHGDTYEEAVKNAREVLELILMPDMFAAPKHAA